MYNHFQQMFIELQSIVLGTAKTKKYKILSSASKELFIFGEAWQV